MRETAPADERVQAARKQRIRRILITVSAVLVLLGIGIWWLIGEMLGYTTYARMKSLCADAQSFARMTEQWKEQSGHPVQTGIYTFSDTDDAFTNFAITHLNIHRTSDKWYGIVLAEDGEIVYTMCSNSTIPGEYLRTPPDREEQTALLESHFSFRRKQAVGVWYADDPKQP